MQAYCSCNYEEHNPHHSGPQFPQPARQRMGSFLFNNNPLLTLELLEKLKALNYLTRSDANKEAKPMGMKIMPTKIKLVMT
jgi:hypothetical protein